MKHVCTRSKHGVALVTVLALVALLSMMLVSFLVSMRIERRSSFNYGRAISAQELAKTALQETYGDLQREIAAGSSPHSEGGYTTYRPVTNHTAMPLRTGFSPSSFGTNIPTSASSLLPPTLVRVSRAADSASLDDNLISSPTWYTTGGLPASRASAVSTTTQSANGRSISVERWNKALFLGATPPSVFSNTPPDWVYVTRSGSRVCTDAEAAAGDLLMDLSGLQTNSVLGRYAYVIYDQGALLDVNVAGYRPTLASSTPELRGKTSLAYAKLSAIPSATNASVPLLSDTTVQNLINWRNKGGALRYGTDTETIRKAHEEGFLKANPGDNPLLSRQDLISYLKTTTGSTDAAAYLTTFTREVNAPSWAPVRNENSWFPYLTDCRTAGKPNRDVLSVRFAGDTSVTRYRTDGTTETYSAKAGEPLVQRRFPLSRIGWLSADGTPKNGGSAASIKTCFGLVWDSANACWNYTGPDGAVALANIATLDEVAARNREPDFFELLKAGILNGSLGQNPGASGNGISSIEGPSGQNFDSYSSYADRHIIQIGANIIDQY
ncbi:MAG: hypothetical protein ACAI35_17360, partial [Candidatus Methylacidiphilales bacterium]